MEAKMQKGDFEMNELMHRKFWSITLQSMLVIFCLGYVDAGEAPSLPDAPKPASIASGAPQNQASAFADIVASTNRDTRLAGWLGVYDALGIPVISQNGMPIGSTGNDPIGPRFWQLWYASGLDLPRRAFD
jgi:hypothetical protein